MKDPNTGTTTYTYAGTSISQSGCWTLPKGGLSVDSSSPSVTVYFEVHHHSNHILLPLQYITLNHILLLLQYIRYITNIVYLQL